MGVTGLGLRKRVKRDLEGFRIGTSFSFRLHFQLSEGLFTKLWLTVEFTLEHLVFIFLSVQSLLWWHILLQMHDFWRNMLRRLMASLFLIFVGQVIFLMNSVWRYLWRIQDLNHRANVGDYFIFVCLLLRSAAKLFFVFLFCLFGTQGLSDVLFRGEDWLLWLNLDASLWGTVTHMTALLFVAEIVSRLRC